MPVKSIEEEILKREFSGIDLWTWRIAYCSIYIHISPMIHDNIGTNAGHIKLHNSLVPKQLGEVHVSLLVIAVM